MKSTAPAATTENFATLFEESLARKEMRVGEVITAEVIRVDDNYVVVNAGLKSESYIPLDEFRNDRGETDVKSGDFVKVAIESLEDGYGETRLSRDKARRLAAWLDLEEALEKFTGALIVVSHDRYFIDRVAENIILVEDGHAEVYAGNYSDLVERFKAGDAIPQKIEIARAQPVLPPVASARPDRAEQKKREKRIKKIDEEIAELESRIASAEGEIERNDLLLCSEEVFRDGERVKKIQQQNHDLKAMIDLLRVGVVFDARRDGQTELRTGHLTRQPCDGLAQSCTVGDEDDADRTPQHDDCGTQEATGIHTSPAIDLARDVPVRIGEAGENGVNLAGCTAIRSLAPADDHIGVRGDFHLYERRFHWPQRPLDVNGESADWVCRVAAPRGQRHGVRNHRQIGCRVGLSGR